MALGLVLLAPALSAVIGPQGDNEHSVLSQRYLPGGWVIPKLYAWNAHTSEVCWISLSVGM